MALNNHEARMALGMINRGDDHHDIAAWFGENQGRIAEIIKGSHGSLAPLPSNDLPPKGPPGVKGRRVYGFAKRAIEALEAGNADEAISLLKQAVERFERSEA